MNEALQGTIVDTLIVGAGLSGIGSAVHLRQGLPDASVLILEARERIGQALAQMHRTADA